MTARDPPIPSLYRYFFLTLEPLCTLLGAYYAALQPQAYLDLTHLPSSPSETGIPTGTAIVLRQLSNLYLCFALIEALVLRATADRSVWRALLLCLLVADLGHLCSVRPVGWRVYWDVARWNAIDWGNVAFVYVGAAVRVCFLAGVGMGGRGGGVAVGRRGGRRKRSARIKG